MASKRDLWTREDGVHELEYKGRTYKNMVMFSRPCATCGEKFGIHVSKSVADGHGQTNNFALKNCEKHRLRTGNAEDLNALRDEVKKLRDREELLTHELNLTVSVFDYDALQARYKTAFEELQVVKARLAKYELGPAMAEAAKNNLAFPWQPS